MPLEQKVLRLDPSLESAIVDEQLDGKFALEKDIYRGTHAKLVINELNHSRTSHREASAWGGDLEAREYMRMPALSFHALDQGLITQEGWNDDVEEFYLRKSPDTRVHYRPRKPTVFIGSKYGPARA
jgi:hypothetical protein